MSGSIAYVTDLLFATRIAAAAADAGVPCPVVRGPDTLAARLAGDAPSAVLIDGDAAGDALASTVASIKRDHPVVRVVVFLPHVEADRAAAAREAGADDVLARSAFVKRLPEILAASAV